MLFGGNIHEAVAIIRAWRGGKKVKGTLCHHPELRPTHWNESKPEPCEMVGCECGENAVCPICGWGWGAAPCSCETGVLP